jgi:hypothetical protein
MKAHLKARRPEAAEVSMKAFRFGSLVVGSLFALGALTQVGCVPDWAQNGASDVILLMTAINGGNPLDSDVVISSGGVCPDVVALRVENHFRNPSVTNTGFRHDITIERYEVRYFRSDGRSVEGVDVPFGITGNVAQEIIEESSAVLNLEVVRRQAKLEPPLLNLRTGGAIIVTMFAEVTLHARTTTGQITNPVSARLQIDFANFGDSLTECRTEGGGGGGG